MTHAQFIDFCKKKGINVIGITEGCVHLNVVGNDYYFPYKNKKEWDEIDELKLETRKKARKIKRDRNLRYQCSKGLKGKCKDSDRCEHSKVHKLDTDVNFGCFSKSSYCPRCKVVKG